MLEIAKTIAQAAKLAAVGTDRGRPAVEERPFTYEAIFDPTDTEQSKAKVDQELKNLALPYRLCVYGDPADAAETGAIPATGTIDGLVYRRSVPYTIAIREPVPPGPTDDTPACNPKNTSYYDIKSVQVAVPNKGPLAILPYPAGAFVTTTYDVEFKDGLLTKNKVTRPSELWGLVQVVPNILKEFASIPAEMVKLKIDYSTKEAELLKAQKAVLDAQTDLQNASTPTPAGSP